MGIGLRREMKICRSMDREGRERERDKAGDRRDKGGSRETVWKEKMETEPGFVCFTY